MKHIYNSKQIQLIYKGHKIASKIKTNIQREIYEIPYISYGYWNPKPHDIDDVIIPLYITDFYQSEYLRGYTGFTFKLRIEVDGMVTWKENLKAGDYELNLGKFEAGMHWFSLQVVDQYGEESGRIANDLWVINEEEYRIKDNEIYTVTMDDLLSNNITINLDDTATVEQMQNNRVGMTAMLQSIKDRGYRKCILPQGTYRVNRADRNTLVKDDPTISPIFMPSDFTVDMNGSTFKMHPYSDTEYGAIAQTTNILVKFYNCNDSHLINGTLEGDYAERQENGWIADSNGEHNETLCFYGGQYNSIDNLNIQWTTGYNVCTSQAGSIALVSLGIGVDGIKLVNGIEVEDENYCTTPFTDISKLVPENYLVVSVWLGYGGLAGKHWDIDVSFYDEQQMFIEKVRAYQYRRCRIPQGAKYARTTFKAKSDEIGNLCYHHMKATRYCELNNCNWIDNRTCCALSQNQHLHMYNCTFTRSGQSITPSAIDLEDGWEQIQDFFMRYCEVIEQTGTRDLIDCAGINHVYEYNKNFRMESRDRINGIESRHNDGGEIRFKVGFMTKNSIRVYNCTNIAFAAISSTDEYYLYDKTNYILRNCTMDTTYFEMGLLGKMMNSNIIIRGISYKSIVENSILKFDRASNCYLNGYLYFNTCDFYKLDSSSENIRLSFNGIDTKNIFNNCTFYDEVWFANHQYYNSSNCNNCIFKKSVSITPQTATKCMGQIQFNNCVFEDVVSINCGTNSQIQFNNCTFSIEPTFVGTSADRCEFNDFIPNEVNYVSIDLSSPYLDLSDGTINAIITQLPYTATKTKCTTDSSNPNIATLDINGVITLLDEGECELIVTNECGVIGSYTVYVKDFDYANKYIYNETGELTWTSYGVADYNYLNIYGGNTITISSPNLSVSSIQIVEYNIDKNVIQFTSVEGSSATIILNENTAYIRVSFDKGSAKDNLQLLYEYTIENVTNK